jgi:hypothetical protein
MYSQPTANRHDVGLVKQAGLSPAARAALLPVVPRVFWWGDPQVWLNDARRFAAQVMTCGDWDDAALTLELLGDSWFKLALQNPPPGVFDIKSWTYWHHRYHLKVPPLPVRKL